MTSAPAPTAATSPRRRKKGVGSGWRGAAGPFGKTYGQWSAERWTWALALPVDRHPLYDTAPCSAGQSGKVWFLGAGFTDSDPGGADFTVDVTRDCTVPAGVALFFPVVNTSASEVENHVSGFAALRTAAAEALAAGDPAIYAAEVDGVPVAGVAGYRVQSPLFTRGPLPDNNLLQQIGEDMPAGTSSQAVADGVHVLVGPLPVGHHTIHLRAAAPSIGFSLDVTYRITVAPGRAPGA